MSLHRELKGLDDKLRGAMNRRDRARKAVNKHNQHVAAMHRKIKQASAKLEEYVDNTAENIAAWTDSAELHEGYVEKAQALLEAAESEVNKRLDELGAI